mmetsp:Transcript_149340/g.479571  ORF Transcript_149340/g.479571 Transcript_149340/m.479571 type:complete len:221 (-) Transcript_149340:1285-1947(-)
MLGAAQQALEEAAGCAGEGLGLGDELLQLNLLLDVLADVVADARVLRNHLDRVDEITPLQGADEAHAGGPNGQRVVCLNPQEVHGPEDCWCDHWDRQRPVLVRQAAVRLHRRAAVQQPVGGVALGALGEDDCARLIHRDLQVLECLGTAGVGRHAEPGAQPHGRGSAVRTATGLMSQLQAGQQSLHDIVAHNVLMVPESRARIGETVHVKELHLALALAD